MIELSMKAREQKVRRALRKVGCSLRKSRVKSINIDNYGEYMVIDMEYNSVALGSRWDATLDEIEAWLSED